MTCVNNEKSTAKRTVPSQQKTFLKMQKERVERGIWTYMVANSIVGMQPELIPM